MSKNISMPNWLKNIFLKIQILESKVYFVKVETQQVLFNVLRFFGIPIS